jgi:protease-4
MAKNKTTIILLILFGFCFISLFLVMIFMLVKPDVSFGNRVAVIELEGVIEDSRDIVRQFKKHREDSSVRAIVFRIDSPGGGIAPSQEIYEAVRKTSAAGKPVIASMGSVAASGGYYVACPADTIIANPGSITGSIGVIIQYPNVDKMLDKIGIKFTTIKSGNFKDILSPFRDTTKEESKYLHDFVMNAYDQFVEAVASERNMDLNKVKEYADGRVYTGVQAKEIGLIDMLGTYEDAVQVAARLGGIEGEPKLVREKKSKPTLFELMFEEDGLSNLRKESGLPAIKMYPSISYQYGF